MYSKKKLDIKLTIIAVPTAAPTAIAAITPPVSPTLSVNNHN